jgi:ATP-dependent RNA helicase SUPV3L1/SUV3
LIINSNPDARSEIKLTPEMLNLLGCSKENFLKLIKEMNYKTYKKDDTFFFKYTPLKKGSSISKKNIVNDNPFEKLKEINFK